VLCAGAVDAQEPAPAKAGVGEALLPILGRRLSPATVSTVAKQLDTVVAAFHARPLTQRYRVLMLDGVVLARKTGPTGQARGLKAHGAIRRPVLVALGLRPDGKKRSSTSAWRRARARPSGSAFLATSSAAASPATLSR
jgi:hypothetical protein